MSAMPHVVVGVFLAEDEQFEIAIGVGSHEEVDQQAEEGHRGDPAALGGEGRFGCAADQAAGGPLPVSHRQAPWWRPADLAIFGRRHLEYVLREFVNHSGDVGVMHPDGSVELRDLKKDIIISGGENISTI